MLTRVSGQMHMSCMSYEPGAGAIGLPSGPRIGSPAATGPEAAPAGPGPGDIVPADGAAGALPGLSAAPCS